MTANGTLYNGTLVNKQMSLWTFPAVSGDQITISVNTAQMREFPYFRVYDPTGAVQIGVGEDNNTGIEGNSAGSVNAIPAATGGTYIVLVGALPPDGGSSDYTISFSGSSGLPSLGKSDGAFCEACTRGGAAAGDPVNIGTGALFETIADYTTVGANPLSLVRYYNSASQQHGLYPTIFGVNWRSNYDRYLRLSSSTAVAAERADGQVVNFYLRSGTWTPDSDIGVSLTNSGSTWTLKDENDNTETYLASDGQALLQSIKMRGGYTQTLSHSGTQLTTVTDSYNRSLGFSYTSDTVSSVTTPDTLVLSYGYATVSSSRLLNAVLYNTSPVTSQAYLYENASLPYALTGITDENGNRYTSWAYDGNGRVTSSQHAGGADLTTFAYDDTTDNRTVTMPLGEILTYKFQLLQDVPKVVEIDRAAAGSTPAASELFTYDANGFRASATDWNGNQTMYSNNALGLPGVIVEASGTSVARTTRIAYDPTWVHQLSSVATDDLGTVYQYDGDGNLITKGLVDLTPSAGTYTASFRVWNYTWDNYLPASVQNPRTDVNATTQFGYSNGALTSRTDAQGHVTKITSHTGGGRPSTIIDPNSVTTTLTYSPRQWLLSSSIATAAGALTTAFTYDAAGNPQKTTLPDGSSLTNAYDIAHRLTQITDALGNYTSYTLDAFGDRTETNVHDSSGVLTWQHSGTFDALGRLSLDTGGAGQTKTQTFDPNGNVVSVTDGLSHKTGILYDALNRASAITDANGGVTTPAYDAHDRLTSLTDANGNATTYVRDGFGEVVQQISPDSGTTVFHYDGDGNLTSRTDALGVVTNQTFDALDRPLTTTYPAHAAENVAYTYDQTGTGFAFGVGRLTSVTDAAGSLTRTYEERGNLTGEKRVNGATTLATGYTYDGASHVATMAYPDGTLVTYQRDAAGYLSTVTAKPAGASSVTTIATLNHAPFGPLNAVNYGNGIAETWTLDASYRATALADVRSGLSIQNLTYTYDAANDVKTITDALNAANSQTFGYDPTNRLTAALSGAGGYGSLAWIYDLVGNRLSQVQGATVTDYGYTTGTNRLATISVSTATAQLRTPQNLRQLTGRRNTALAHSLHFYGKTDLYREVKTQLPSPDVVTGILGWPMVLAGFSGILSLRRRLRYHRLLTSVSIFALLTGSITVLNGCGGGSSLRSIGVPMHPDLQGAIHGGQQPVTGATIQLYAVGISGDGSAATPLISSVVKSDQSGSFTITGDYTCPAASTNVYLVATGGNPGLTAGTNNSAIAMMAGLGPCGALSAATFVSINEVTTVGSLAALYPYMTGVANLGSGTSDANQFAAAFAAVNEYANTTTGTTPGPALPAGFYASNVEINTLGNIVASCINSTGGTAGDGSACGTLFQLAAPTGATKPTDTIAAVLDILKNPTSNIAALFNLSSPTAPFQPSLSAAPASWSLPIVGTPAAPAFSLNSGTYTTAKVVTIADTTAGTVIYYTIDGSLPSATSHVYTGGITITSTETLQAIAITGGALSSPVTSALYTLHIPVAASIMTNANGNITSIPPANSTAYATFSYNNANRLASVVGSPTAATFVYDWAGQRFSKTDGGTPPTIYSYAEGGTLIAENDNGTVTDYIYADGRPIAMLQTAATPAANQVTYVVADRLGTPQVVSNSSGSTVWSATYQPFGTTGNVNAFVSQNLRFPGQIADAETGFSYNLNRDYVPNLGRYLQTDPSGLQGGLNTYAYASSNPGRFVDPAGLDFKNGIRALYCVLAVCNPSIVDSPVNNLYQTTASQGPHAGFDPSNPGDEAPQATKIPVDDNCPYARTGSAGDLDSSQYPFDFPEEAPPIQPSFLQRLQQLIQGLPRIVDPGILLPGMQEQLDKMLGKGGQSQTA
jgi:RHS repeat-associated protein